MSRTRTDGFVLSSPSEEVRTFQVLDTELVPVNSKTRGLYCFGCNNFTMHDLVTLGAQKFYQCTCCKEKQEYFKVAQKADE